MSPAETT